MRTMTYIIDDTVVEKSEDGSVITIRKSSGSEKSATAVGSFSYKVGNCRVRITQDRSIAKIKDGQDVG